MGKSVLTIPAETLRRIAAEVGTPTYVYDADAIRAQYQELTVAFADIPHRIFYSVKSNSNLSVLRLLRDLGAGADIVSGGELARTRCAGIPASDGLLGEVKRIGIRSSTVRTWSGAELIVPNAELVSERVTNWTLSDPAFV